MILRSPKILLTIAGAFLFNLLFWQEKMAINALLFDLFILAAVLRMYPEAVSKTSVRWILVAHIVSLAMVIIYNTMISKIAAVLTIVFFAAFAEHIHRSVIFAAGTILYQASFMLPAFVSLIKENKSRVQKRKWRFKKLKLLLFPLALVCLFFILYTAANRAFASLTGRLIATITNYITQVVTFVSWERLLFVLLGGYITGVLIIKSRKSKFSDKELSLSDRLIRRRSQMQGELNIFDEVVITVMGSFSKGIVALKNKNLIGLISFILLNMLLLIINLTDVVYIWTGNDYGKNEALAELLHEGTGLLVFSVLMAMVVILFFFNGNLNFYKNNKKLKIAAYAWILQNAFLVASVAMRDYYYISHFGLAYKRLGVIFFLVIVLAGLTSVFIKIYRQKSNYFLFRFNGNVLLIVLVLASLQNWDVYIARYNIARIDKIRPDVEFLMRLSDQTLPIIREHLDILSAKSERQNFGHLSSSNVSSMTLAEYLAEREQRFLIDHERRTWLSWNVADATVLAAIKKSNTTSGLTSSVH